MLASYIRKNGGPDVIECGEVPTPVLGNNSVLVRVKNAALNHLDIWVRQGLPGVKLTFPHILCGDASGVVEKVSAGVTHVKPGDEVIVHPGVSCGRCERCLSGWESLCKHYEILGERIGGVASQWASVPSANVFIKPANLTFPEAASIPLVFTTAWQMVVNRAKVTPGDTVLVHAAGSGVSSAAIQIARLFDARVIATAGSAKKLELAKALGAEWTINYRTEDFVKRVKELTAGKGVDAIIDHTGVDNWEKNIRAVRWGGKLVLCGSTSGPEVKLDLRQVFFRQIEILGSTMGSKGDFSKMLSLFDRGRLKPVVDKIFPLKETMEAHQYVERREQFGKVVLEIGDID
jgi:NADPH:quinone reductase-like Zn-dependent oxidoreductase